MRAVLSKIGLSLASLLLVAVAGYNAAQVYYAPHNPATFAKAWWGSQQLLAEYRRTVAGRQDLIDQAFCDKVHKYGSMYYSCGLASMSNGEGNWRELYVLVYESYNQVIMRARGVTAYIQPAMVVRSAESCSAWGCVEEREDIRLLPEVLYSDVLIVGRIPHL